MTLHVSAMGPYGHEFQHSPSMKAEMCASSFVGPSRPRDLENSLCLGHGSDLVSMSATI